MNATAANLLDVFYNLLKTDFSSIYRYGFPPNREGEFIVLNAISNSRDIAKTSDTTRTTHSYSIAYINVFVPKIDNGTDVYSDSLRISTIQTLISNLIETFEYDSSLNLLNSCKLYLDGDANVENDLSTHTNLIFRVTCNYS